MRIFHEERKGKNDEEKGIFLLSKEKSSKRSCIKLNNSKMQLKKDGKSNNIKYNSKVASVNDLVIDAQLLKNKSKRSETTMAKLREERRKKRNITTERNAHPAGTNSKGNNSKSGGDKLQQSNSSSLPNSAVFVSGRKTASSAEKCSEQNIKESTNDIPLDNSTSVTTEMAKNEKVDSRSNEKKETREANKENTKDIVKNVGNQDNQEDGSTNVENEDTHSLRKRKNKKEEIAFVEEDVTNKRPRRKCIRNYKYEMYMEEEKAKNKNYSADITRSNANKLEDGKKIAHERDLSNSIKKSSSKHKTGSSSAKLRANNASGNACEKVVGSAQKENVLKDDNDNDNNDNNNKLANEKTSYYYCNVLGNDVLGDSSEKDVDHKYSNMDEDKSTDNTNIGSISKNNSNYDCTLVSEKRKEEGDSGNNARGDASSEGTNVTTFANSSPNKNGTTNNSVTPNKNSNNSKISKNGKSIKKSKSIKNSKKGKSSKNGSRSRKHRETGKGKLMEIKVETSGASNGEANSASNGEVKGEANDAVNEVDPAASIPYGEDHLSENIVEDDSVLFLEKKKRGRKKKMDNKVVDFALNDLPSLEENTTSLYAEDEGGKIDLDKEENSIVTLDMNNDNMDLPEMLPSVVDKSSSQLKTSSKMDSGSISKANAQLRKQLQEEKNKEDSIPSAYSDFMLNKDESKGKHIRRKNNKNRRRTTNSRNLRIETSNSADGMIENGDSYSYNNDSTTSGGRLFPNETFQIKEEFMNNVNNLNTVFNFNEEFLRFLRRVSRFEDIDYDTMLSFLGEIQIKLANTIKQEFSNEHFDSHNVDEAVYAMSHIVDILNNNNEILNKLNQLEYKFYYDYLRNKSLERENNYHPNYTDSNIALNIARIPRNINNECCAKIQRNSSSSRNNCDNGSAITGQEERNPNFGNVDVEEARKLNEILQCATNREIDDTYKVPNYTNVNNDVYFMSYNNGENFHQVRGNCNVDSKKEQNEETSHRQESEYRGEEPSRILNTPGERRDVESFIPDMVNKSTDERQKLRRTTNDVCLESRRITNWSEREEEDAINKMHNYVGVEGDEITKKINDLQSEFNMNRSEFQNEHAHKLIYQNNVDFVCDELNKLIKNTLKNEDTFYANYSDGRYRNVSERSLYTNYVSTKLYKNSSLLDGHKEERKERVTIPKSSKNKATNGFKNHCKKEEDRNEKKLMDSYTDYFRRMNDVSSNCIKERMKNVTNNAESANTVVTSDMSTYLHCTEGGGSSPNSITVGNAHRINVNCTKESGGTTPINVNLPLEELHINRDRHMVRSSTSDYPNAFDKCSSHEEIIHIGDHNEKIRNNASDRLIIKMKTETKDNTEDDNEGGGTAAGESTNADTTHEGGEMKMNSSKGNRTTGFTSNSNENDKEVSKSSSIFSFFRRNKEKSKHKEGSDSKKSTFVREESSNDKEDKKNDIKIENSVDNQAAVVEEKGEAANFLCGKRSDTVIFDDDIGKKGKEELKNSSTLTGDILDMTTCCANNKDRKDDICNEKEQTENSTLDVLVASKNDLTNTCGQNVNCTHCIRNVKERDCEKTIDTLLKETFHFKDDQLISLKVDKTQKEILDCLRMVSKIKKIFFDECTKMINDQICALEKNFKIPNCSLSILKNSFGYSDDK
ncbi:conserved Plasmodium protein, unknown function [Plasmodium ovale wallikeri]|uniref:Uncharacterized protein n=1 Tax=Plasmodium ovale wallikeri TaxID=864142 RepID=A0A1A8ZHS9_PLAOA|nr:conserved Plasmodium protein, unknown function [Plasmodium ovale wallikeri]